MGKNFSIESIVADFFSLTEEDIIGYFPLSSRYKIGCFRNFELWALSGRKQLVEFNNDLVMERKTVNSAPGIWLVYTDESGDQFGALINVIVHYYKQGQIDIDRIA